MTWEDAPVGGTAAAKTAQIASLTGLRGFAALMVVLIHVTVLTEYSWLGLPDYGPVSLFVLSGFLLYRPWARWGLRVDERPSVRAFAYRRVTRIFPAYLVVLFVVCAVYPPVRPEGMGQWLRAVTLTWIYQPGDFKPALQQTWSLATELSWYVALPVMGGAGALLARHLSQRRGFWTTTALLLTAVPISVAWRWWVDNEDLGRLFTYSYWLPGFLACFASGALVAHAVEGSRAGVVDLDRVRRVAADPWALVVLAVAVALLGTSRLGGANGFQTPISFGEHLVRATCATLVAVTLLVAAVLGPHSTPLNQALSSRWFQAIGRWSYGIFLWHLPLIVILDRDVSFPAGPMGLLWRLVLTLGLAIPLGAATYAWVERPTLAWSRRRVSSGRATAIPSTSNQPSTPTPAPSRSDAPAE